MSRALPFSIGEAAATLKKTMMSSSNADTTETACANCDKAESDDVELKRCTSCKMVKYCSRDCQVTHRPKHKNASKKRTTEKFEKELFKDHPEREKCPICMLPLPFDIEQSAFQSCCGKILCLGCLHIHSEKKILLCPVRFAGPALHPQKKNILID